MQKMKELNINAYEWLEQMLANTWARAFFSTFPKCDILLNNSCEVFNKYILDARELPVLSMLERIKSQLMTRHYNKQKEVEIFQGICPKIRKKVLKYAELANVCYVLPAGYGIFEVQEKGYQYRVDIKAKTCDCRRWDLTGIPCQHAISCLRHERISSESVLPIYYSIEAFNNAYGYNIWPCQDISQWEEVHGPEVLPPKYEKRVGRPPKARRKQPHEVMGKNGPKLTKHGVEMHCSWCKSSEHNAATCKLKKAGVQPKILPKRRPPPPFVDETGDKENEEPYITQVSYLQHFILSTHICITIHVRVSYYCRMCCSMSLQTWRLHFHKTAQCFLK